MQTLDALTLWYACIGQKITDASPEKSVQPNVPTRSAKQGVIPQRIGQGAPEMFIACETDSYLMGAIELPNQPGLSFVNRADQTPERFLAHWLLHKAPIDKPWMVGRIRKARALDSLHASQPPALCRFCEAGKSFDFSVISLRIALAMIDGLDWKKIVVPALYAFESHKKAVTENEIEAAKVKLEKQLKVTPALRRILPKFPLRLNSGEYEILSWYYRDR